MKRTGLLCMMMFCVLYAQSPQTTDNTVSKKAVRTVVSDISVQASDKAIILNWKLAPDAIPHIKELLIFRSYERISSIPKKPQSPAFLDGSKAEMTDKSLIPINTVPPEINEYRDTEAEADKIYYYAVAAREKSGTVYGLISPALNASLTGVSLKSPKKSAAPKQSTEITEHKIQKTEETQYISPVPGKQPEIMREKPLASLRIFPETPLPKTQQRYKHSKDKTSGKQADKTQGAKEETESLSVHTGKEADILPKDTSDKGMSGDDYSLFVIVDALVKTKKWPEAEAELKRFLQINRSTETTERAYFYLGQSLYFNGKYREALTCFQKSQALYPVLSKRWSIETLDAYRIE